MVNVRFSVWSVTIGKLFLISSKVVQFNLNLAITVHSRSNGLLSTVTLVVQIEIEIWGVNILMSWGGGGCN